MKYIRPPKAPKLGNFSSIFSPIVRLGKLIGPYIRAGLPIILLLLFIAVNILIWWLGPKFEWDGEYPLSGVTSRILMCLVFTLIILVCFAIYNRKEMTDYYEDKRMDELLKSDLKFQYVARQTAELDGLLNVIKEQYKSGDYLYGLPWYLMVGLDQSGKTSLINRSGQEFLFSTTMKASQFKSENPLTFNWWVSDKAIFIDPDSELLSQAPAQNLVDGNEDPKVARHLWIGFLDWIGQRRARRPLNGIILSVDISYLASANLANRKVYAGILRARVREIMECFASRVPVYIVLTKLDLLHGFAVFFKNLTKAEREQLFGFTFKIDQTNSDQWLDEFLQQYATFMKKVNDLLPKTLMETRHEEERWALYSFARQLAGLENILHQFLKEVLVSDKFSSATLVRGVYFTSVYQQGVPTDVFINASSQRYGFSVLATRAQNYLNSTPFFTYDLFNKLILQESGLATDNLKLQEHKRRLIVTASTIGAISSVVIIGLFYYLYSKNINHLHNVENKVNEYTKLSIKDAEYDPTGEKLRTPLNLIGGATLEFGNYREKLPYISDLGMYLGHKIGPEVDKTYLELLSYKFIPALMIGLNQEILQAAPGSDEQLGLLRVFTILTNKQMRDLTRDRNDNPEIAATEVIDYFSKYWHQQFEGQADIQKDLVGHLDYAMKYTDVAGNRKQGNRLAIKALSPYDEMVKKAQKDLDAIPMEQRVYSSFKRKGLSSVHTGVDLRKGVGTSFEIIFNTDVGSSDPLLIPGLFTKKGLNNYYIQQSENISELALIDNWMIGTRANISYSQEDINNFRDKLRDQYGRDYEQTWKAALTALDIRDFEDINHGTLILDKIVGTERPLLKLLSLVQENTQLAPVIPDEEKAKTTLLQSHPYQLWAKLNNDFAALNRLTEEKSGKEGEASVIYMEEVNLAIQNVYGLLKYIKDSQDIGQTALKTAKDRIQLNDADAIYALHRISARLPQPMDRLVGKIADESWNVILLEAIKEIDRKWNNDVYSEFNRNLAHKYPFNPTAKTDVSLEEFEDFFGKNGVIDRFYQNELKPFLEESSFKSKQGDSYRSLVQADVLIQLENAQRIQKAFFNNKGVLGVEFTMSPLSMGAQAQRSLLNIEGQYVEYMHGPRRTYALIWPNTINSKGNQENSVKLTLSGLRGGTINSMTYNGPWALFRMLDQSHISSVNNNTLDIGFTIKNISMRYQLIAQGEINPFTLSLLRSFKLSPSLYK